MPHFVKSLVVASLCSLGIAACGGGGGGGGGGSGPPTPTVPLAFTDANAGTAAGFVFRSIDQLAGVSDTTFAAVYYIDQGVVSLACRAHVPVPIVLTFADNDHSGTVTTGDVISFSHPLCNGIARDLKITVTNAVDAGQHLEGRIDFKLDLVSPALHAEGAMTLSMSIAPTEFRWTATEVVVRLTTGVDTQVLQIPSADRVLTPPSSLIFSAPPGGPGTVFVNRAAAPARALAAEAWLPGEGSVSSAAEPASSTRAGFVDGPEADVPADAPPEYQLDFSGTLTSPPTSLGGSFTFATGPALGGTFGAFPTAGALVLTASTSKLRIRPATNPSGEQAEYQIDATGAGAFSDAKPIRWDALDAGNPFGYRPNTAPQITDLRITPANPTVKTDLYATYTVFDAEDDPVETTFEWRRNGVVMTDQTVDHVYVGNFMRGDTLAVTLSVSDGRASSSATATAKIGNIPPLISSVTISPSPSAYTNDDLTADAVVTDEDGDPLLPLRYEWRRGGIAIPGQTNRVLPASAQAVGDRITVLVTASDGLDTTTLESQAVSIIDSPIQFRSNAPVVASYGSLVTFKVEAFDPDDATATAPNGPFTLTHGPAGMTIDPATGVVTWLARLAMFDRAVDVSWGVTKGGGTVVPLSSTIRVEDPGRSYALARNGIQAPMAPAALRIGDFDGDGDNEILIAGTSALYELSFDGAGGYAQSWMYPFVLAQSDDYASSLNTALATGDIDGDGKQELFLGAGDRIVKLDGVERRVVASADLPSGATCSALELADLDNDGTKELVCLLRLPGFSATYTIRVYSAADLTLRVALPAALYGAALAVGDVDGDGFPEIVTSGGYVFDGRKIFTDPAHSTEWVYPFPGFGSDVAIGNVDGVGPAEIIAATDTGVRGYSAVLKTELFNFQTDAATTVLVADIDNDPSTQEIVAVVGVDTVQAYRYDPAHPNTPTVLLKLEDPSIAATYYSQPPLAVGNVDADPAIEFVYATGTGDSGKDNIVIAGRNGSTAAMKWTNTDPSNLDGPFVGGELAGAPAIAKAVVFCTARTDSGYGGTRLIRMNPADGRLAVSPEINTNAVGPAAIASSDYDRDGTDEIFLSAAAMYDGYFAAYDVFAGQPQWTGPTLGSQVAAVSVVAADLNGDGHDDLVGLTSLGVVQVYDVFNNSVVWQSSAPGDIGVEVLVADLDGDGTPEIVAVTRSSIYVYRRASGPNLYVQAAVFAHPSSNQYGDFVGAAIGDIDGDGRPEIAAVVSFNTAPPQSELYVLDRNLQPTVDTVLPVLTSGITIENSAFPRKNVLLNVTSNFSYAGVGPSYLAAFDPRSALEVWRSPPLIGSIALASVHYVDPDGSGNLRLSVGTKSAMYITR